MLNLNYNSVYQYKASERKQLKKLKRKYGRKYQKLYGASKKRVWYDGENKSRRLKHNIVNAILLASRFRCAYCSKRLIRSEKPIDHFIPNSLYPKYSYHTLNLVPSCGYCNTYLKKTFDPLVIEEKKYSNNKFSIVHPILNNVDNHICYDSLDKTILEFKNCSVEGLITIELFELHSFEMMQERINQFIINRDNPLSDESLIRLVNECATYQITK